MSSFNRRALLGWALCGGATAVSGCFRPMLAEGSSETRLRGKIALPKSDGRFEYHLSKSLKDRLGTPSSTEWSLEVTTKIGKQEFAVAQDNSVTRITLTATSNWTLRKRSTGEVLLNEVAFSQSGYSATTSLFATRQTELDLERRLARDIGERISRRIYANAEVLLT